jgi:hypothetical protein
LQKIKIYVKKNALKFKNPNTNSYNTYEYNDIKISCYENDYHFIRLCLCNQKILVNESIVKEMFDIIVSTQKIDEETKKNKTYANCIKKINRVKSK